MSRDKNDQVILHIPIPNLQNPKPLYYQTVHGKRIIGGYEAEQRLSPLAENFINENLFLSSIHIDIAAFKTSITREEKIEAITLFETYPEISYIVLDKPYSDWSGHKTSRLHTVDLYSPWLQSVFGDAIYEDELIIVYRVDGRETALSGSKVMARGSPMFLD